MQQGFHESEWPAAVGLREDPARQDEWLRIRGAIAAAYQNIVWAIARQLSRGMPRLATTCEDELVSMGQVGLLRAIDRFEPSRGYRFQTFCGLRIRGSILDEFRRLDHVPRRAREIAKSKGESLPAILYTSEDLSHAAVAPDGEAHLSEFWDTHPGLDAAQRKVLQLRYVEDMTTAEIGERLCMPRALVTRIHQQTIRQLRTGVSPASRPKRTRAPMINWKDAMSQDEPPPQEPNLHDRVAAEQVSDGRDPFATGESVLVFRDGDAHRGTVRTAAGVEVVVVSQSLRTGPPGLTVLRDVVFREEPADMLRLAKRLSEFATLVHQRANRVRVHANQLRRKAATPVRTTK